MSERVSYRDYFKPEDRPRYPRVLAMTENIVTELIGAEQNPDRKEAALWAAFTRIVPFDDRFHEKCDPNRLEHEVQMTNDYNQGDTAYAVKQFEFFHTLRNRHTQIPDLAAAAAVKALLEFDAAQVELMVNG